MHVYTGIFGGFYQARLPLEIKVLLTAHIDFALEAMGCFVQGFFVIAALLGVVRAHEDLFL